MLSIFSGTRKTCPEFDGSEEFFHNRVLLSEHFNIPAREIFAVGDYRAAVAPAGGGDCRRAVALFRNDHRYSAAHALFRFDIGKPFVKKTRNIKIVAGCVGENRNVARPALPFVSLRAVRRNINKV